MKLHINFKGLIETRLDIILGNGDVMKLDFGRYK